MFFSPDVGRRGNRAELNVNWEERHTEIYA
jgi:hypothetical protein